jgi:hypothetical protein
MIALCFTRSVVYRNPNIYDFIPMTGLFMLAFSFALNTDTQKPHTHVFPSHMVVIVHHVAGKDMCVGFLCIRV